MITTTLTTIIMSTIAISYHCHHHHLVSDQVGRCCHLCSPHWPLSLPGRLQHGDVRTIDRTLLFRKSKKVYIQVTRYTNITNLNYTFDEVEFEPVRCYPYVFSPKVHLHQTHNFPITNASFSISASWPRSSYLSFFNWKLLRECPQRLPWLILGRGRGFSMSSIISMLWTRISML